MNWGRWLKDLVTLNWREKIISFVLAFLFWFMIKAQDARHPPYVPPQPVKLPTTTQTIPAPPQLEPTLEPTATTPVVPPKLEPVIVPEAPVAPPAQPETGVGKASGL